jgi:sugar lactone lactonase YvrE
MLPASFLGEDRMRSIIAAAALATALFAGPALHAAEPVVIDDAALFPEGPVWHEGKLWYVEYAGQTIKTWDGNSVATFWRQDGCGPSAVAPLPDGRLMVTCYDAGTMVTVSPAGETVATADAAADGTRFVGPNDLVVDKEGGVWFTCSGPWESGPIVGRIFRIAPDGTITPAADDLHYANGIALSPDGETLYVNESEAYRTIAFTIGADGTLTDRRLFVRLADVLDGASGHYADGVKVDAAGNLWIGEYSEGVIVQVDPSGKLLRTIEVPSAASPNLAFGPDGTIYVMAVDDLSGTDSYRGKVYAVTP